MLKDLPFFGTTRVANKGVDVALIVRPSHTAEAFSKAVSAIKKRKGGRRSLNRTKLGLFGRIPAATLQLYGFCDKMTRNSKMKSAVILAAGLSSRMMDFKPLLPFGGTTVIQHTVSRMLEGGAEEIILVTGFLATEVERIFRDSRVRFVHNRDYAKSQMFDSVCLGLAAARGDEIFLLPADLPQIDPTLLNRLSAIPAQAVYPVCHGKNGHPLLLRRSGVETVLLHDGTQGLKGALERLDTQTIETEDLGCLLDIDNPEDYQKLLDFRAESVPTEGECQELLQFFETSERTQAHCEAVCRVAAKLADGLSGINREMLFAAARIHDAARNRQDHPAVLAEELERRGYRYLASVVRVHMDLPDAMSEGISEHALLYLADKLVIEDQYVGIDRRFQPAEERFRDKPEILRAILHRKVIAQRILNSVRDLHIDIKEKGEETWDKGRSCKDGYCSMRK